MGCDELGSSACKGRVLAGPVPLGNHFRIGKQPFLQSSMRSAMIKMLGVGQTERLRHRLFGEQEIVHGDYLSWSCCTTNRRPTLSILEPQVKIWPAIYAPLKLAPFSI